MGFINKKLIGLCLFASCTFSAMAAPLFPDVPENHWAKDAVAALAAKGLVEGYPDGTFKGDRSATRWETAMIVARLLAKMEQAHATFATKAELDELRKLANALREELDALGVRVDNLEENVSLLDKRVTELERITFYGNVETRVVFQSFRNQGPSFSDPTDALINFDNAVGSVQGAGGIIPTGPAAGQIFDPFAIGTFTATDLNRGTPLVSGTGFTALATLGLNIKVSDDIDAGAEFVAFTSQGSSVVDAFYGVNAPFLSNAFTATTAGASGIQPLNNQPFTRMTLDNFWVHHKPSNITARVGSFDNLKYDSLVYALQYNPNAFGSTLPSYGFQVTGKQEVFDGESLDWEVMGNRLPDGNPGLAGAGYDTLAWGGNIAFNFHDEKGQVKINFLRAANDASNGNAQTVGLITGFNNNYTPWVNPPLYFQDQINGVPPGPSAGAGSTGDIRPVPVPVPGFNDGITGIPGTPNYGSIGPQEVNLYSFSGRYIWEDNEFKPFIRGEWGHSEYKASKNSPVNATGDAWRVQAGAVFFKEALAVDLEYLQVDPTYDPFVLQMPTIGGIQNNAWRFGENFFNQRPNLYNLHDTADMPHNRKGFRGKLRWKFADEGSVGLKFGFLEQTDPSVQNVRQSFGSIENSFLGTPNSPVLGFAPGFTEPVFGGLSPFTFTTTPPSNPGAAPNLFGGVLETPSGNADNWAIDAKHRWVIDESAADATDKWTRGITLRGNYNWTNFNRDSNLRALLPGPNGIAGESQNNVDLTYQGWSIGADWDVTRKWTLNASYGQYRLNGHYDPYGIFSNYAVATNNTSFDTFDLVQSQPVVGFEYDVSEGMTWDMAALFLSTDDKVNPAVFSNPVTPGFNNVFIPQRSLHGFDNAGIQVTSTLRFNF